VLNTLEASFLSGLLSEFRSLMALTLPIPASYVRVMDGIFSSGTYVTWGIDNRETPVRLAHVYNPQQRNFEVKMMGGTANPHFALAGILAAGVSGIERQLPLKVKECSEMCAADLEESVRADRGISEKIPANLDEARECLKQSEILNQFFTQKVIEKYLSLNHVNALSSLAAPPLLLTDLIDFSTCLGRNGEGGG
jgi:glutamine synthetase